MASESVRNRLDDLEQRIGTTKCPECGRGADGRYTTLPKIVLGAGGLLRLDVPDACPVCGLEHFNLTRGLCELFTAGSILGTP